MTQHAEENLAAKSPKKIVLLVMDGVAGCRGSRGGKTELESARTAEPRCAGARSECGVHLPIATASPPGSAPGHRQAEEVQVP